MDEIMGTIKIFAFNFAPRNWALCNGQIMPITQNTALFSLLGTTYGGNGVNTFALPDLRSKTMVGVGQGTGLSTINWGETAGTESTSLNANTMPLHLHGLTMTASYNAITDGTASNETDNGTNSFSSGGSTANIYSEPGGTVENVAGVTNTINGTTTGIGSNLPFDLRNPYLAMNHCILLFGIFPSRN
ncbi:tail fiber protein [Flavobacterium sp. MC2016-06]|jgi:microcystin-dependent protein|uniref:phage tail protein n=1 Tax=Flavobacterium sp. MC2016-06 TaxID=2676308 RepID=UPI0012BAB3C0|nr:tail fiber protein [Flavobacterium sp. MC2016-06]MBU3862213.1 tail fiber protein [Flavobacterium sp. MC2016-06]